MKGKLLSSDWKKKTTGFRAERQHCATAFKKEKTKLFLFCLAGSRGKLELRAGNLEGQMESSSGEL